MQGTRLRRRRWPSRCGQAFSSFALSACRHVCPRGRQIARTRLSGRPYRSTPRTDELTTPARPQRTRVVVFKYSFEYEITDGRRLRPGRPDRPGRRQPGPPRAARPPRPGGAHRRGAGPPDRPERRDHLAPSPGAQTRPPGGGREGRRLRHVPAGRRAGRPVLAGPAAAGRSPARRDPAGHARAPRAARRTRARRRGARAARAKGRRHPDRRPASRGIHGRPPPRRHFGPGRGASEAPERLAETPRHRRVLPRAVLCDGARRRRLPAPEGDPRAAPRPGRRRMARAGMARGRGRRAPRGRPAMTSSSPPAAGAVRLGLRENLPQFTLLVVVNAFVGAMAGLERSILPAIAEREFQLAARTAVLSFIVVFGVAKALTNYGAGRLS